LLELSSGRLKNLLSPLPPRAPPEFLRCLQHQRHPAFKHARIEDDYFIELDPQTFAAVENANAIPPITGDAGESPDPGICFRPAITSSLILYLPIAMSAAFAFRSAAPRQ
jgi:hypothetical protein